MRVDDSAPEYLMVSQRRWGHLDHTDFSEFLVEIGDLGGGNVAPKFNPNVKTDIC